MPSHFLGIYVVLYDYTPQSEQELPLQEGDILYVLEKSEEDDWWKAKKRTLLVDEDEPEGLVPCNYIEEAKPKGKAKASYDYTRQTQEELSFTEDAILDVYDIQDPDWTLVGCNGEYGFAPANYIEINQDSASLEHEETQSTLAPATLPTPPGIRLPPSLTLPPRSHSPASPLPPSPGITPPDLEKPLPTPRIEDGDEVPPTPPRPISMVEPSANNRLSMHPHQTQHRGQSPTSNSSRSPRVQQQSPPHRARFADDEFDSDSDGPSLPVKRPPHERRSFRRSVLGDDRLHPVEPGSPTHIPPGFRTFPVQELIGKKKHAALLALGPDRIILVPDKSTLPRQEWSIENMLNYSVEGKHVFIDCNYPTKAMDLHAGSKEGAAEVFSALGEINGAARAAGLREVLSAAEPKYRRSDTIGTILWDFVAGGQDEVSVAAGDEVTILDDKDADWWLVKRTVNGLEGVVPSSYVERGRTEITPSIDGKSKESKPKASHSSDKPRSNASPSLPSGVQLPVRTTSLAGKRHGGESGTAPPKTKPDPSKLRTWTDRSKTFKVEAQFLGCKEGKIHLHKSNGVKIAVPVAKMAVEDLEYVEKITGLSLDEEKPLSYVKSQQGQQSSQRVFQRSPQPQAGITIEKPTPSSDQKKDYDWFDFFLQCGIDLGNCQRYALSFQKEQMDETFLPDLTASLLRSIGMKEGDILRAMKFLDNKYGRNDGAKKGVSFGSTEVIGENGGNEGSSGGLFSGPGGMLKNNTGRKGRPAPAILTSDTVDPNAFLQKPSPPPNANPRAATSSSTTEGFEDDVWAPKPSKQAPTPQQQPPKPVEPPKPVTPPVSTQPPAPAPAPVPVIRPDIALLSSDAPPPQPTAANPPPLQAAQQLSPPVITEPTPPQQTSTSGYYNPQATQPTVTARQRPTVPQAAGPPAGSLIPPPPQRPISAPQTLPPHNVGPMVPPLQVQMTGIPLGSTAPPGQLSMADQLHNMRMQQIQQQQESLARTQHAILAQMTGMANPLMGHATGLTQQQMPLQQPSGFMNGLPTIQAPQPTLPRQSFQPLMNQSTGMLGQPTAGIGVGPGMTGSFAQQQRVPGQPVTINNLLPPPLGSQQTGFGAGLQPLMPQPTGPPPPVRFGVQPGAPKLAPQPTGRRANLSQATPENPFGF